MKLNRRDNFVLFLFLLFILIIYLFTLFPGPGGRANAGDSLKWQFIGKVFGTPHPTGYPLFIIISAIFSRIPLPLPLFLKVNLISTLFAILTLFFLFKILRLLKADILSSVITTSIFAFGKIFWSQATEAEVYTLNSFFIVLILYLSILWDEKKNERFLSLSTFFFILSLSNHITVLLLLPSLLIFIILTDPRAFTGKRIIFCSAISLLILSFLYIFLIWRSNSSIYSEFPIKNSRDFFYFISGGAWKKSLYLSILSSLSSGFGKFSSSIQSNITFSSLTILGVGIFILLKNFKLFLLIFLSALSFLLFSTIYSIRDVEVNYIPVYLLTVILMGTGMDFLLKLKISKVIKTLLASSLIIIPISLFVSNYKELKVKESYWGEWIKMVFSNFKRETLFISDYINYDQDMALSYAIFGLDYIKNKNFVIGENFTERDKIIEDYLEGTEISFKWFKLDKGMKIVCFDEGIAMKLSRKFKVEKRVISDKTKIVYFRIMKKED